MPSRYTLIFIVYEDETSWLGREKEDKNKTPISQSRHAQFGTPDDNAWSIDRVATSITGVRTPAVRPVSVSDTCNGSNHPVMPSAFCRPMGLLPNTFDFVAPPGGAYLPAENAGTLPGLEGNHGYGNGGVRPEDSATLRPLYLEMVS
jgi:hypothetical protein